MLPPPQSLLPSTILSFHKVAPLSPFSALLHLTMHLSEVEVHQRSTSLSVEYSTWKNFWRTLQRKSFLESRACCGCMRDIAIGFGGLVTCSNDRGIFVNIFVYGVFSIEKYFGSWVHVLRVCKFTRINLLGSETFKGCLLGRIFFSCDFGLRSCDAVLESLSRA